MALMGGSVIIPAEYSLVGLLEGLEKLWLYSYTILKNLGGYQ